MTASSNELKFKLIYRKIYSDLFVSKLLSSINIYNEICFVRWKKKASFQKSNCFKTLNFINSLSKTALFFEMF